MRASKVFGVAAFGEWGLAVEYQAGSCLRIGRANQADVLILARVEGALAPGVDNLKLQPGTRVYVDSM